MGRVSSKRKLKSCDPFFKGSRSNGKASKEYDLAPPTSKKRKRKHMSDDQIENYVMRISEVNGPTKQNNKKSSSNNKLENVGSIRPNETMKEFNKRINTEVRRVIYDETKKTKRKTQKRKEYVFLVCLSFTFIC